MCSQAAVEYLNVADTINESVWLTDLAKMAYHNCIKTYQQLEVDRPCCTFARPLLLVSSTRHV